MERVVMYSLQRADGWWKSVMKHNEFTPKLQIETK